MKIENVISMLNSISDTTSGSNLQYRFEKEILNDAEFSINHIFTDKRQADFYYSVLKDIPNNELELITSTTSISEKVPYVAYLPEITILFKYVITHSEFRYNLKFKSTFNKIKEGFTYGN